MGQAEIAGSAGDGMADSSHVLVLREFGLAFGERVIIGAASLSVPPRGCFVLMGPAGTGKSSLLRALVGHAQMTPTLTTWGEAHYLGAPVGARGTPRLVAQNARLLLASVFENIVNELPDRAALTPVQQRRRVKRLLERTGMRRLIPLLDSPVVSLPLGLQRQVAILREVAVDTPLVFVDEPTTGLDDAESEALLSLLLGESEHRAVFVVLHNQQHARRLGGMTALLAGGHIQETRPTEAFLTNPDTDAARSFLRSGNCALPAPDADPETLAEDVAPPPPLPAPARDAVRESAGPRGFVWLIPGVIAGTPRPGVIAELDWDLAALRRVGVTALVSLTQREVDAAALGQHGIQRVWSPIVDMRAPSLDQAEALCARMQQLIEAGDVLAVHCRAGLGRTGTILAAYLIWNGKSALDALEAARRCEPRWVQSDVQVAFLEEFAAYLADAGPEQRGPGSKVKSIPRLEQ